MNKKKKMKKIQHIGMYIYKTYKKVKGKQKKNHKRSSIEVETEATNNNNLRNENIDFFILFSLLLRTTECYS